LPLDTPVPDWTPPPSFLDGPIVVPGLFGVFLLVAAPLLWFGAHGAVGGYLVLYWVGIVAILVGLVCAFLVGLFNLATISLGGIAWVVLERVALAVGPSFGWAAVGLVVLGVVLVVGPARRLRQVAAAREAWSKTKGGSVPPE
jgi:hypothetical protein